MRLGTRYECVGSSSSVSGVCQDSAREFVKRIPRLAERLSGVAEKLVGRPRFAERLSEVAEKLAGSWDGLEMDVCGISPKFTRRFAEGIGKLAGNMPGDRQKKTRRLIVRMLEAAGLAGVADDG
ncbi:hypothetical protein BHE74_00036698 [Ensete ventricosum]|nr:hypothetical protein BHE74_00036698 [Ensete ventricosum]